MWLPLITLGGRFSGRLPTILSAISCRPLRRILKINPTMDPRVVPKALAISLTDLTLAFHISTIRSKVSGCHLIWWRGLRFSVGRIT